MLRLLFNYSCRARRFETSGALLFYFILFAAGFSFDVAALSAQTAHDLIPIPALRERVTDQTGTLDSTEKQALEKKLADFEGAKGGQIAVLIVPSTKPETIEEYSIRVAEEWKLGRKQVDDGVLLIVAKEDRELRIEVGYGLEGAIPDVSANRIIEEFIVPRFKRGEFYGGIFAGVSRLMDLIEGEELPPPRASSVSISSSGTGAIFDGFVRFVVIAVGILFLVFGGVVLSEFIGPLPSAGISGLASFGLSFLFLGLAWGIVTGVALLLVVWAISTADEWAETDGGGSSSGSSSYSGSSFSSGSSSYSSSGSSSSSGGFSGGGGSFGGGGASGSW